MSNQNTVRIRYSKPKISKILCGCCYARLNSLKILWFVLLSASGYQLCTTGHLAFSGNFIKWRKYPLSWSWKYQSSKGNVCTETSVDIIKMMVAFISKPLKFHYLYVTVIYRSAFWMNLDMSHSSLSFWLLVLFFFGWQL